MASSALAKDNDEIGRITYLDKKYWAMRIQGDTTRDAAMSGIIRQKDVIQTIANQHLIVLMDDGTELLIGPSSRVAFTNWTSRDSEGRLIRTITLQSGMLKAKVRKIYSQEEPFIVENKFGVVAVRGTEFVVESGSGGRLEHIRTLTPTESHVRKTEMELHTLEGEVHFAANREGLLKPDSRVTVTAGQTSLIREGMLRPQVAHTFDVDKFRRYVAKAAPANTRFDVVKGTTNTRRAERSENARLEPLQNISPARPMFAKVHQPSAGTPGANRQIASLDAARTESGERSRRTGLLKNARTGDEPAKNGPLATNGNLTNDGVKDSFSGEEPADANVIAGEESRRHHHHHHNNIGLGGLAAAGAAPRTTAPATTTKLPSIPSIGTPKK